MRSSNVISKLDHGLVLVPISEFIRPSDGRPSAITATIRARLSLWDLNIEFDGNRQYQKPKCVADMVEITLRYRPPTPGLANVLGWMELDILEIGTIMPQHKPPLPGHRYVATLFPWYGDTEPVFAPVTIGPFGVTDGRHNAVKTFRTWVRPSGDVGRDGKPIYRRFWSDNTTYLCQEFGYDQSWRGPVRFCDDKGAPSSGIGGTDNIDKYSAFWPDPSTIQFVRGNSCQIIPFNGFQCSYADGEFMEDAMLKYGKTVRCYAASYNRSGVSLGAYNFKDRDFGWVASSFYDGGGSGTDTLGWLSTWIKTSFESSPETVDIADNNKIMISATSGDNGNWAEPVAFDLDSMTTTWGQNEIFDMFPYRVVTRHGARFIDYYQFDCARYIYDGTLPYNTKEANDNVIATRQVWDPTGKIPADYDFNVVNPTSVMLGNLTPVFSNP